MVNARKYDKRGSGRLPLAMVALCVFAGCYALFRVGLSLSIGSAINVNKESKVKEQQLTDHEKHVLATVKRTQPQLQPQVQPRFDYNNMVTLSSLSAGDFINEAEAETEVPSTYPKLSPLRSLLSNWDQNALGVFSPPPEPFVEELLTFDFQDEAEMEVALKFREAEVPFKVRNIPGLREEDIPSGAWTDEFLNAKFRQVDDQVDHAESSVSNTFFSALRGGGVVPSPGPRLGYTVEASRLGNFFLWYDPRKLRGKDPPQVTSPKGMRTFREFWDHARKRDLNDGPNDEYDPNDIHYYAQLGIGRFKSEKEEEEVRGRFGFILDRVPFFRSTKGERAEYVK